MILLSLVPVGDEVIPHRMSSSLVRTQIVHVVSSTSQRRLDMMNNRALNRLYVFSFWFGEFLPNGFNGSEELATWTWIGVIKRPTLGLFVVVH